MENRILFSILTPTHNRKDFLPKLIDSLENQECKDFEWIIADDGSDDGTFEYLKNKIKNISFSTLAIKSDIRIGKSKIDNLLIDHAVGENIIWCDSDDYFEKDTLSYIKSKLTQRNKDNTFIGVIGQNLDTEGKSQTFKSKKNLPDDGIYSWEFLENVLDGDGTISIPTSLFGNSRFPEIDFVCHEGILLKKIFKNKSFFFTKKVLKIMNRSAENSVTHGKKIEYARGSFFAMSQTLNKKDFYKLKFIQRLFKATNFFRYALHGDVKIREAMSSLFKKSINPSYFLCLAPALMLALRDNLTKKVTKTHIEFDKNIQNFKISRLRNNAS